MARPTPYVGRFAPSPTGPLHAGSLIAALASFLDARQHGGIWQLRIDDIDPPREVPGATQSILECLQAHGLEHDGDVIFQSQHSDRYHAALRQLTQLGYLFRCQCTRATLGPGGVCINHCDLPEDQPGSLRISIPPSVTIDFTDLILGPQRFTRSDLPENFIVRRRDGLYAYQLAAAIDDAQPATTHVIRGRDLLESTPRQRFIQQCLKLTPPRYGHLPILVHADGTKLSKQTGAPALDNARAPANLRATLLLLGQLTPPESATTALEILDWAIDHWHPERVTR